MRQQSRQQHQKTSHTDDLEQVGREFAEWRRTRNAPARIPDKLWTRAAALAAQHGVNAVARALRLNHTQLKCKMETVPAAEPTATFVELLPSVAANIGECAVEVESHRGSRMRIVMRDVPPLCLAGVLREFVG